MEEPHRVQRQRKVDGRPQIRATNKEKVTLDLQNKLEDWTKVLQWKLIHFQIDKQQQASGSPNE